MDLYLARNKKTFDGVYGNMTIGDNPFNCFTCENRNQEIPAGKYRVTFDRSPEFNRIMPHIWVPSRDVAAQAQGDDNAGIRIHWGNYPSNYRGCIGVGSKENPDSLDDTLMTFNRLYSIICGQQDLFITITEDFPVAQ